MWWREVGHDGGQGRYGGERAQQHFPPLPDGIGHRDRVGLLNDDIGLQWRDVVDVERCRGGQRAEEEHLSE